MIKDRLIEIGLTNNEAEVYLHLLKSQSLPASTIAKGLRLNRSTVYQVLNTLTQKGFCSTFNKNNSTYFQANDPNCLLTYLEKKSMHYDYYKAIMSSYISDYRRLFNNSGYDDPKVNITFGSLTLTQALKKETQGFKAIINAEELQLLPRRKKSQLIIFNFKNTPKPPWTEYKLLPDEFQLNIVILSKKVFLFSGSQPGHFTITLNSSKITQSYNYFFTKLWRNLS